MAIPRGFPKHEYEARVRRAQKMMAKADIAALLLTTEPEVRYFTGFLTRFWESPTRPWFVIVPSSGKPIAVIPSIGADLMAKTWIDDIRTWRSPDLCDDGVTLLADALRECTGMSGRIGLPDGHETHIRMPLANFERLKKLLTPLEVTGDADSMRRLRLIKSEAEIEKITHACKIAGRAFARMHEFVSSGKPLDAVFRNFQSACLDEGADWVPYLAGGAGPSGYGNVISPADGTVLETGDVLMLDTGLVWDGYFCDYDRNVGIGWADHAMKSAYARLIEAVDKGLEAARPGATAADLFHVMDRIVTGGKKGDLQAGRLGHGLGMQLTEWPSLIPDDHTVLEEGMVLTLEPGIETGKGTMLVHEENIVITANGARMLSPAAPREMPVIG